MKYILRPYKTIALSMVLGAGVALAPMGVAAQTNGIVEVLQEIDPLLHGSSQGYLGVLVTDVDNDSAAKLKLKEAKGALITLIDHDAPAGQIGLRVNDVVLELNGQRVEGAEQFGRMLREFPAGRKVNLLISRDGSPQTIEVQLCDRKVMEKDVWNRLSHQGDGASSLPTWGILTGNGDAPMPGFHMPFFGSALNVGAMVEPLTPQTADYLGVSSGILIKQIARKSEAAAAGLQVHDVILKVGNEPIATTADWDRALRANQGKTVQVTIQRDRKQQVLNLKVDSKHKSEVTWPGLLPDGPSSGSDLAAWTGGPCPLLAELDQDFGADWAADAAAAAERLRQQAEELRRSIRAEDFKVDQKQIEEMKRQMEQFRKNFKADAFKIDQKQLDELKKQMEEFRKSMPNFQRQMEQFRHEMEQMRLGVDQQV